MTSRLKKAWQALIGADVKNYAAADINRLTYDWPTQITSPTQILRYSLTTMRSRSRQLIINNDYARRFIAMIGVNVIGPNGIALQCKAKWPDGKLDKWANDRVENGWYNWGEKGSFDVTGTLSMQEADRLGVQAVAGDGEIIVRIIEGFDNEWGFAVQFYEVDHLDDSLNIARLGNGNSIRMGIEFDKWFRPVAYHLLTEHPGDWGWSYNSRKYIRVPAEDIIHPFVRDRINQPRGVPWMHSAMTRLNNIGAYEEAAIIAARIGASKMGFLQPDDSADIPSAGTNPGANAEDEQRRPISEVEPGLIETLPRGYTFQAADWKYPDQQFGDFMKASLRGISSGLLVSYNSLASDLEGVNFSSIRAGVLEERDNWKLQQAWWVANYKMPIYRRWLRWQLLTQRLDLPLSKLEKFLDVKWQPRTWPWVDPEKDISAKAIALKNKLTSWTKALAEDGIDLEEHLLELKNEQELAAKYGIELKVDEPPQPGAPKKNGNDDGDQGDPAPKKKPDVEMDRKGATFNLTVNSAPVSVTTPEVKNEITVQPAAPAEVKNEITVQPAAPAEVKNEITVQPAQVAMTLPEMKVENYTTVQPAAPAEVKNEITVQPAAPAEVKNEITVKPADPAPIEVKNEINMPRAKKKKKKMTMFGPDGSVRGVVEES